MGLEVLRSARTRRPMAAMFMLSTISMASPALADGFDAALRQYAQTINEHGVKPGGTVSASVDGRTFTLNVVSKSAITPERIQQLGVREQVCSDPAVRAAMAETTFMVRVVVSAPNLPTPIVTPVKSADCDAIAGHTQTTRSSIPASGTGGATGSHAAASADTGGGRPFDFKGVPLGISLADFRHLPHPDGERAEVACTGDTIPAPPGFFSITPSDLFVNDANTALGVRRCIWVGVDGGWTHVGREVALRLAGTEYYTTEYRFAFAPDPKDGVLRLYRFEGIAHVDAAPEVTRALAAKFGKPEIGNGQLQNGMGNTFEQEIADWKTPVGSITVQSPATAVNRMAIVMIDKRLSDFVDDAKSARQAAIPNGI